MFHTTMILETFEILCKEQHKRMKDQGFWDEREKIFQPGASYEGAEPVIIKTKPINIGEKLMLMVSELSEMFEAYRKNKLTDSCDKDCIVIDPQSAQEITYGCKPCKGTGFFPSEQTVHECPSCKGEGKVTFSGVRRLTNEEEELADVVIRVLDYCGWRNIDLGRAILAKMEYNQSRPYRHGKTC